MKTFTQIEKIAWDYYHADTQEQKCEILTNFNLLSHDDKKKVVHRLFKYKTHEKVKELLMSVEYRNDFPFLLDDQGIYLFYLTCLYGSYKKNKDIV